MRKNSMIPLAVLDEHPDWLSPLYDVFKKRNIPFVKIDLSSAFYYPEQTDILPFYVNRLSPSAAKRNHESAFSYAFNYIHYLEGLGTRVINGSRTVLLETNKAMQSALLHSLNISQPPTIILNDLRQISSVIDTLPFPVVLKPNRGGSGMGIEKFQTKEELLSAIQTNAIQMPSDQLFLLQSFIESPEGNIVRVETVNGKVIYAMKVFSQGTFNLCPSNSCDLLRGETKETLGYCVATPAQNTRFELYKNPPQDVLLAIEQLVKKAGLEVAGIEYVVDKNGKWYIYDINALSILRASFKEEYGIDGWGILGDFLIGEYKKTLK